MSKKVHTNIKKNLQEKNRYQNMVKNPTKDLEVTNDLDSQLFYETSETLNEDKFYYNYNTSTNKPVFKRIAEFTNEHIIGIAISVIGTLIVWNIVLQISDAVKSEKINFIEKNIAEINSKIDNTNSEYVRKDIFDLTIDTLKESINRTVLEIEKIKK